MFLHTHTDTSVPHMLQLGIYAARSSARPNAVLYKEDIRKGRGSVVRGNAL
jgi:tRNA (Thr-GGU) A37 N-methylase